MGRLGKIIQTSRQEQWDAERERDRWGQPTYRIEDAHVQEFCDRAQEREAARLERRRLKGMIISVGGSRKAKVNWY